MKKCTKCGEEKGIEGYYGGLQPCKTCRKKYAKDRYNPVARSAYNAKYYVANRTKLLPKQLAYNKTHPVSPEQQRMYSLRWLDKNRTKVHAYQKEYGRRTSDKHKMHLARRRARIRIASEVVLSREVFERDGWICAGCNQPVDPTLVYPHPMSASLDHRIPLSRGGAHTYVNTQLMHLRCNQQKRATIPTEERGYGYET